MDRTRTPRTRQGFGLAATLLLAGCDTPLSTLAPAGDSANAIAILWWVMLLGSVIIFCGVLGAALYPLIRRGVGAAPSERGMLIGGGLVFPAVVLLALLVAALLVGDRLSPRGEPDVLKIEAVAERWAWTFHYPDGRAPTRDVLHVPTGVPFEVHVSSRDVIHSFWLPRLGGKIDAIPGQVNVIRLQAAEPGIYRGQCAEFCGVGHAAMSFTLQAHDPEDIP